MVLIVFTVLRLIQYAMNNLSPTLHRAVERARWLAELGAALDHADKLALALSEQDTHRVEAIVLRDHIQSLRSEVDLIQTRRRPHATEIHPNWM